MGIYENGRRSVEYMDSCAIVCFHFSFLLSGSLYSSLIKILSLLNRSLTIYISFSIFCNRTLVPLFYFYLYYITNLTVNQDFMSFALLS